MPLLSREFYRQGATTLAQALLGQILVHRTTKGRIAGRIVETEAYLGERDPASHAFRGPTKRNFVMFGEAGHAYIYFTYGMHYCFNVVAGELSVAEAVLVRAIEPTAGLNLIFANRPFVKDPHQATNGPAKLVQALAIKSNLNGHDLTRPPLTIMASPDRDFEVVTTTRVGITQARDLPLRFYIKENPYVSKV